VGKCRSEIGMNWKELDKEDGGSGERGTRRRSRPAAQRMKGVLGQI
jgi:hypothetical protein